MGGIGGVQDDDRKEGRSWAGQGRLEKSPQK